MRARCAPCSTARSRSTRRSTPWRMWNRDARRARSSSPCRPPATDARNCCIRAGRHQQTVGCRAKRRRYDPSKGRLLDALEPYWSCAERHPVKWLLQGGIVRRCVLLTLSVLCLSGCTTTSTYRPNALAPLTRGSIDTFVALVSSSSGQPRCKKPVDAPLGPGANAVAWVFPRPLEQQITVVLDAAGTPTRYVDVRGDLSPSDDSVADR